MTSEVRHVTMVTCQLGYMLMTPIIHKNQGMSMTGQLKQKKSNKRHNTWIIAAESQKWQEFSVNIVPLHSQDPTGRHVISGSTMTHILYSITPQNMLVSYRLIRTAVGDLEGTSQEPRV